MSADPNGILSWNMPGRRLKTELLESPDRDSLLEKGREEAQGVEVFEDLDATIEGEALKEGAPGHETLTGDSVGLGVDDEEDREEAEEETW